MIEIYGKTGCTFCHRATVFCELNDLPYKYLQLDEDFSKEQLLAEFPEAKTFPQIKRNGMPVGGYNELVASSKESI